MEAKGEITVLLDRLNAGDTSALSQLFDEVYGTLRSIAAAYMRRERPGHVLQATAVVNEAYIRLFGGTPLQARDHEQFFKAAAGAMRRLLIDQARNAGANKRNGGLQTTLHEWMSVVENDLYDEIDLQRALDRLAQFDRRQAEIMEMVIYAGRTAREIADLLNVNVRTVYREISSATVFLRSELSGTAHDTRPVGQR